MRALAYVLLIASALAVDLIADMSRMSAKQIEDWDTSAGILVFAGLAGLTLDVIKSWNKK